MAAVFATEKVIDLMASSRHFRTHVANGSHGIIQRVLGNMADKQQLH
jgi:hypothetical protein